MEAVAAVVSLACAARFALLLWQGYRYGQVKSATPWSRYHDRHANPILYWMFIVGARNYSQPHSQEARVGRLVPIVIVTAIDIFYRLGDLVGVLPDIVQRGDSHCVEFTSG